MLVIENDNNWARRRPLVVSCRRAVLGGELFGKASECWGALSLMFRDVLRRDRISALLLGCAGEVIPMHPVRVFLWTVAMAYTGFLLTGQGLRTFNSLSITEAFLGALTGCLLAIMFTLRERRRQRPAFAAYSIEQIFPNWDISRENRGSHPKP